MRLIRCRDMRFEEFIGDDIPPYAILSHTWSKGEVTFKDFDNAEAKSMAGWYKVEKTCEVALQESLEYAWVDTCCIDKSSSAELTEAINSMFQWYARSRICYVFLEDCDGELGGLEDLYWGRRRDTYQSALSRWMSRGWTLQELIAPQTVVFFDREWQRLSTRRDLSEYLNQTTGISREILERDQANIDDLLETVPVCRKMYWACSRKTTRVEDMAYYLMGLFGVNMPLLYGEGPKAFIRLQEEIIRHSNDLTIFAWEADTPEDAYEYASEDLAKRRRVAETEAVRGVLALSPREFEVAENFEPTLNAISQEYTVTDKGIQISSISIQPVRNSSDFLMDLDCFDKKSHSVKSICIRPIGGGVFVRVEPDELRSRSWRYELFLDEPFTTSLYLKTSVTPAILASLETIHHGAIRLPKMVGESFYLEHIVPPLHVQRASDLFITRGYSNTVGYATYCYGVDLTKRCDLVVFFGTGNSSTIRPWSYVTTPKDLPGFNYELSAWEENLKRHGLDAQLQAKLWVRRHDGGV